MAYRNHSRFRAVISSPVTLLLAAVALFFLAKAAWNIHGKASESASRLESAQNEFAKLENSQKEAAATVDRLSTPAGIESVIREKYHAVEPGESVAVIMDTPPGNTMGMQTASTTQPLGFWAGLLRLLGL